MAVHARGEAASSRHTAPSRAVISRGVLRLVVAGSRTAKPASAAGSPRAWGSVSPVRARSAASAACRSGVAGPRLQVSPSG